MCHNDIYEIRDNAINGILPFLGFSIFMLIATAVFIGTGAIPTVFIIFAFMVILVEFTNRQNQKDRRFIRNVTAVLMILCTIWATLTILAYPVSALSVEGSPDGAQMTWNISGGTAPYTVWMNEKALYQSYPSDTIITDTEPGKTYHIVIEDAINDTATATATGIFYTYPIEIWCLMALFVALMVASYFVPFAAFGAALVGGFLMMMVGPNPDYAGYLRLIACAAFIGGLGAIFVGSGKQ